MIHTLFLLQLVGSFCLCASAASALGNDEAAVATSTCQRGNLCSTVQQGTSLEHNATEDGTESYTELAALKQLRTKLSVRSVRQVDASVLAVASTPPPHAKNVSRGAELSGVTLNEAGDLDVFLSGLISNIVMIVAAIAVFAFLAKRFPKMYSNNVCTGVAPFTPPPGMLGWAKAAISVTIDEVADSVGLDNAMLLSLAQLYMRILAIFGLPMLLIMGPLNCAFGGHVAGQDYLSYLSLGNVQEGSWLFWIHAFVVWAVVIVVKNCIYQAMRDFLVRRHDWLLRLPHPRATTVLVEGIPPAYQSDADLKHFFGQVFDPSQVKSAYVVKCAPQVKAAFNRKSYAKSVLSSLMFQWEKTGRNEERRPKSMWGGVDQIQYYTEELEQASKDLKRERASARTMFGKPGGINGSNGFVCFSSPQVAHHALAGGQYSHDLDNWVVSVPPPPRSILWHDLELDSEHKFVWTALGYLLVLGLYCIYLPSVIWITDIANHIVLPGSLQSYWASLAPTIGLQFMVAFLPTFLIAIFRSCFTLNDDAWAQQVLQNWYYVFQLVFVILVVAIGQSLFVFMYTLFSSPFSIFRILADTMPSATHFYMNFVVTTWTSHATNLTRMANICKFFLFSRIYEEEEAVKLSEPEDQDYYGLGSRHARFTILMSIGIIFGQLSPPIPILVLINFAICRLIYGYLVVFAETKKPDLGGEFFAHALKHIFTSCIVYCLLMSGVLFGRAATNGPGIIAVLSLPYVFWSLRGFDQHFTYEKLSYEQLIKDTGEREDSGLQYIQPEWLDDEE